MPAKPASWFRGLLRLGLILAIVTAIVEFGFPLIFGVQVDVPAALPFASASAMTFRISNQGLTPLTDVEYSCEVATLIRANGSAITDANVLNRGSIRKLAARRAAAGRCQTGYLIAAPLKTVEYRVTVNYRAYPWNRRRTSVFRIAAQFNGKGEVTGWTLQ